MEKTIKEFLTDKVREKGVVSMIEDYNLHHEDEDWIKEIMDFMDECVIIDSRTPNFPFINMNGNKDVIRFIKRKGDDYVTLLEREIKIPVRISEDAVVMSIVHENFKRLLKEKILKKKSFRLQQVAKFFMA